MSADSAPTPTTARDGAFELLLEWDRGKSVHIDGLVHGLLAETDLGPSDRLRRPFRRSLPAVGLEQILAARRPVWGHAGILRGWR